MGASTFVARFLSQLQPGQSGRTRRNRSNRLVTRPGAIELLEDRTLLAGQVITPVDASPTVTQGSNLTVGLQYSTTNDNNQAQTIETDAFILNAYYDSSALTLNDVVDHSFDDLTFPIQFNDPQNNPVTVEFGQVFSFIDQADAQNDDNDASTDRRVTILWVDPFLAENPGDENGWPVDFNQQPLLVADLEFTANVNFTGNTPVNFERDASQEFVDFTSTPVSANVTVPSGNADLDLDGNGSVQSALDVNYIFLDLGSGRQAGQTGGLSQQLLQAFNPNLTAEQAVAIQQNIDTLNNANSLDLDGVGGFQSALDLNYIFLDESSGRQAGQTGGLSQQLLQAFNPNLTNQQAVTVQQNIDALKATAQPGAVPAQGAVPRSASAADDEAVPAATDTLVFADLDSMDDLLF